jgi:hypothetical protein
MVRHSSPAQRSALLLLQLEQVVVLYLAVGIQVGDEPIRYSRLGGGNTGAQVTACEPAASHGGLAPVVRRASRAVLTTKNTPEGVLISMLIRPILST